MPNPLFTVDRRPCVHIADPISFGGNNAMWGSPDNYGARTIDLASGNRLAGIGTYEPIGVQRLINIMQYNYERGIRRFMINSPQGTITVENNFPAYGGIWTCMQQRFITAYDGTSFVNPNLNCWPGRTTVPTLAEAQDLNTAFFANGRTNEFYQHLRTWLISSASMGYNVGLDGVTPMSDKRPEVELYIYTGFGIPYKNGNVHTEANYVHVLGNGANGNFQWQDNTTSGFKMPDPANIQEHSNYLQLDWRKWFECGVNGIGQDVGVYAWNHRHGDWVYEDSFKPTNYNKPLTNIRKWFTDYYNSIPVGFNPGDRFSSKPFKLFLEAFPWDSDPNKIINRSTNNNFVTANTNEYYSFWNPLGSQEDSNSTAYKGSWMHYAPYIVLPGLLSQFSNGGFPNTNQYCGADPNRKWKFDKDTTEIHLLIDFLAKPYADLSELNNLSLDIGSAKSQEVINKCVEYWKDYLDRGYVYMPAIYTWNYLIEREINKKLLEYLGVWPSGQVA